MNATHMSSTQIRRRLRRSAEVLVDDVGLRSNLLDEQAQQLLDWGLNHVRETARQTAPLTDEDAYPLLEERVTTVRRIMRLVNRLMRPSAEAAVVSQEFHTARLLKSLTELIGQDPGPELLALAKTFTRARPDLDDERAFQLLMEIVSHELDETGEEE